METDQIVLDRLEARKLWRKYQEHRHWSEPIDQEIARTYRAIAQGRVVVKALSSIIRAGVNSDGYPKLAICRADAERCYLSYYGRGAARMASKPWVQDRETRCFIDFPEGTFPRPPETGRWARREAIVPLVPIDLRPKRGLANYHILWEAIWQNVPPVDPLLLRRVGPGDLWIVVAAWDLTEVEQAVLAARIRA